MAAVQARRRRPDGVERHPPRRAGHLELVEMGIYGPVTDKQKEACASIKRSAQSLLQLVDDVLQLTRAEAGKIDARPGTRVTRTRDLIDDLGRVLSTAGVSNTDQSSAELFSVGSR